MRGRARDRWGLPRGVVDIVIDICIDYDRRRLCIETKSVREDVRACYERLNSAIDEALLHAEPIVRQDLFTDIKTRRGYAYSPASTYMCKSAYYARKRKVIYAVAEALMLT
ncbi:MAG: hypothetical protein IKA64_01930 [Clostridia bacterium]|nr:hypothetical protein [Clostridia bacterium]